MREVPGGAYRHHPARVQIVAGAIAQLGERLVCNQEVTGSNPVGSIELTGSGGLILAN